MEMERRKAGISSRDMELAINHELFRVVAKNPEQTSLGADESVKVQVSAAGQQRVTLRGIFPMAIWG